MKIKLLTMAMFLFLGFTHPGFAGIAHVNEQENQVTVLYASAPGGQALELPDIKAGVFSNAIASALSGKADNNENGIISQNEFIIYVRVDTKKKSKGKQSVHVINPWIDSESSICGKVTYVLAIGINYSHTQEPHLSRLRYAVSDAKNIASTINKQCKKANIVSYDDKSATKKGIIDALNNIKSQSKPDDNIIISYSGNGVSVEGRNYIIPSDASNLKSVSDIKREGVDIDYIIKILARSRTKNSLLLLDTSTTPITNNATR